MWLAATRLVVICVSSRWLPVRCGGTLGTRSWVVLRVNHVPASCASHTAARVPERGPRRSEPTSSCTRSSRGDDRLSAPTVTRWRPGWRQPLCCDKVNGTLDPPHLCPSELSFAKSCKDGPSSAPRPDSPMEWTARGQGPLVASDRKPGPNGPKLGRKCLAYITGKAAGGPGLSGGFSHRAA